jgi:hypothetical protein
LNSPLFLHFTTPNIGMDNVYDPKDTTGNRTK